MKEKSEFKKILSDLLNIRNFYFNKIKKPKEIIEDNFILFERIFQELKNSEKLIFCFYIVDEFSKKILNEFEGQISYEQYVNKLKSLSRNNGINYFSLINEINEKRSKLESLADENGIRINYEVENVKSDEKILHYKKCNKKNIYERINNLLKYLKSIYNEGGLDCRKFEEVYEGYLNELNLLRIKKIDISKYPKNREEMEEFFKKENKIISFSLFNSNLNYQLPQILS